MRKLLVFLLASSLAGAADPAPEPRGKIRIYQMLPRLFGNTNETRKPNGSLPENGVGKFADLNARAIASLKEMGFTHVWLTGIHQQATATDYSHIGEPPDDPDLLKGLAGSPYAIRDYFDVCPDYAVEPARRLEEFRGLVTRLHEAGLRVLIDFVPNHVARSHVSTVRPDLSFGAGDDRSQFFRPDNNFFWLTPESGATGGPPLRLPTVDAEGRPVSPTAKVAPVPSDGLFEPEKEHGRVTGNNLVSWAPDSGSWYETVKLNYGYNFLDATKSTKAYPHAGQPDAPVPDTWKKMDEIIAYWQGLGVDGFRVDMAHMVPPEFWQWMIARARGRNAEAWFVAEAYDADPSKVPSGDPALVAASRGNVLYELLASGFDAVYDDATYDKLKEIYDGGAWANDLDRLGLPQKVAEGSLRYAENHDEVRLASAGNWGGVGMDVGRPVAAVLFGLGRGPVMLYHGQEVGEPAAGIEGFGGDDGRSSIFDYWSMPELAKWVNGGAFDGGKLDGNQKALRDFYGRLVRLVGEPAFGGAMFPLNPSNEANPRFARLPGESASGHWVYAFLRYDPPSGQRFLVVANFHPTHTFNDVRIELNPEALRFLETDSFTLRERLEAGPPQPFRWTPPAVEIPSLPPLTPLYLELVP
jgi:glycosidase